MLKQSLVRDIFRKKTYLNLQLVPLQFWNSLPTPPHKYYISSIFSFLIELTESPTEQCLHLKNNLPPQTTALGSKPPPHRNCNAKAINNKPTANAGASNGTTNQIPLTLEMAPFLPLLSLWSLLPVSELDSFSACSCTDSSFHTLLFSTISPLPPGKWQFLVFTSSSDLSGDIQNHIPIQLSMRLLHVEIPRYFKLNIWRKLSVSFPYELLPWNLYLGWWDHYLSPSKTPDTISFLTKLVSKSR